MSPRISPPLPVVSSILATTSVPPGPAKWSVFGLGTTGTHEVDVGGHEVGIGSGGHA